VAEELERQVEGASEAPEAEAAAQEGAAEVSTEGWAGEAAGEPSAPTAETADRKVNLDEFEEFRRWKSKVDSRLAEREAELARLAAERQRLAQELADARQQLTAAQMAQLDALDPEDQVAVLRQQLEQFQQQQRRAQELAAQEAYYQAKAAQLLKDAGLTGKEEGLDWGDIDPMLGRPVANAENYARLATSVARLAMSRGEELTRKQREEAQREARKAQSEALRQAGVTKVPTVTGTSTSNLRAEYERERAALKGTGDYRALIRLRKKYAEKGLEV